MSSDAGEMSLVIESRVALDWLSSHGQNRHIETALTRMAGRVLAIVADCIALSVTLLDGDLTFTLLAESCDAALLDALQYVDRGLCVQTVDDGHVIATQGLPTDEGRWHLLARGWAPPGVASTLSLPIMIGDRPMCSVNLYASTPEAFDGHHERLAVACGAWAQGAVTNADLSFSSRLRAAAAPARLREQAFIEAASDLVAERRGLDIDTARARMADAAARAGIREADVAKFILDSIPQGARKM